MCCARSDMVQCLQIRPVNLKHTSTQQLLINVFVWHSFPMKKFLKLIASVILENARIFNSKNVKFIFSNFLFDFRVRFSTFSTFFRFFELAFFDFFFSTFRLWSSIRNSGIYNSEILSKWVAPSNWFLQFRDGGGVYVTTLRCRRTIFEIFYLEHQQVSEVFHYHIDIIQYYIKYW